MMRKFKQNKLWRDDAVAFVESHGSIVNWRMLEDEEFVLELKEKLMEEAAEVRDAQNKDELIEEMADLFEVVDTILKANEISKADVLKVQTSKKAKRGGFEGRKFVESAAHPEGGVGEGYCLADPEKYPEILD